METVKQYLQKANSVVSNNPLAKQVCGLLLGLCYVFGVLSLPTLFNVMYVGLFLHTVREILRYQSCQQQKTESNVNLLTLVYYWMCLSSMLLSYSVLKIVIMYVNFMYIPELLINLLFTGTLVYVVRDLRKYYSGKQMESFKLHKTEVTGEINSPTLSKVITHTANFYSVNMKVYDKLFMFGANCLTYGVEVVYSGFGLAFDYLFMGFVKACELYQQITSKLGLNSDAKLNSQNLQNKDIIFPETTQTMPMATAPSLEETQNQLKTD